MADLYASSQPWLDANPPYDTSQAWFEPVKLAYVRFFWSSEPVELDWLLKQMPRLRYAARKAAADSRKVEHVQVMPNGSYRIKSPDPVRGASRAQS